MGNNQSDQASQYKYEDFKIIKSLQTGAFGRILLVELKSTKEQFIMKRLQYISDDEKKIADEEIKMLKLAQSKYTVQLIAGFNFDVDICILQEFCSGGNLRELIENMKTWTVEDKIIKCQMIFFQVLMSLKHLHQLKIVHRDLKPENIFLDKDGNAKTGDFGLALKMASKSQVYAAGTQMTEASDIWALGVIVVEMITGVHPFKGLTLDSTIENIINGRFKALPDYVKGELKEMLISMISSDPVRRPTAAELLDSELMQHLKPFDGTIQQRNGIKKIQESNCDLITNNLEDVDDDFRKKIVKAGIIEGFNDIFENREHNLITRTYSLTIFQITSNSSDEVKHLIYSKKPYPGLVRLLEHTDILVASDAIASIFLLLETGSNT
ncbi:MAG: putative NEK/NEK2 protein kinase, partial [Streblomastix strix]